MATAGPSARPGGKPAGPAGGSRLPCAELERLLAHEAPAGRRVLLVGQRAARIQPHTVSSS
ncbi:hypothetical protein ABZ553_06600 [Streptomyces sparsogenes]|uniref:hypothetical protein n=1 Tax=Streptomyces sparsogenes TaxID=67365 RepID=UPI0034093C92